jgi:hypothetical protein
MLTGQLRELIESYVAGTVQVSEFSERFAVLYIAVRQQNGEPSAAGLCNAVVGPLAEYSRGHRAEASLRLQLGKALYQYTV